VTKFQLKEQKNDEDYKRCILPAVFRSRQSTDIEIDVTAKSDGVAEAEIMGLCKCMCVYNSARHPELSLSTLVISDCSLGCDIQGAQYNVKR